MEINPKFELKQEVFIASYETTTIYVECAICKGEGKLLTLKDRFEVKCPRCSGKKKTSSTSETKYIAKTLNVNGINIKVGGNMYGRTTSLDVEPIIEYDLIELMDKWTQGYGELTKECDIFKTLEEAQLRCDKLNSGDIKKIMDL